MVTAISRKQFWIECCRPPVASVGDLTFPFFFLEIFFHPSNHVIHVESPCVKVGNGQVASWLKSVCGEVEKRQVRSLSLVF